MSGWLCPLAAWSPRETLASASLSCCAPLYQVQKQSLLSLSAQDTHRLWEEEIKARARLSLRLAELEREKVELSGQVTIWKGVLPEAVRHNGLSIKILVYLF